MMLLGSGIAYVPCDHLADEGVGKTVETYLQLPHNKTERRRRPIVGGVAKVAVDVVDDVVEDVFKLGCISAHWDLGKFITKTYITSAATPVIESLTQATPLLRPVLLGVAAGIEWLVAVSVPIEKYVTCDAYGDSLGDFVQTTIERYFIDIHVCH